MPESDRRRDKAIPCKRSLETEGARYGLGRPAPETVVWLIWLMSDSSGPCFKKASVSSGASDVQARLLRPYSMSLPPWAFRCRANPQNEATSKAVARTLPAGGRLSVQPPLPSRREQPQVFGTHVGKNTTCISLPPEASWMPLNGGHRGWHPAISATFPRHCRRPAPCLACSKIRGYTGAAHAVRPGQATH